MPVRCALLRCLVVVVPALLLVSACSGETATFPPAVAPTTPPAAVTSPAPSAPPPASTATPPPSASAQPPRATTDGYEPSVRVGNITALNAARVPFASYLNAVHNRIHRIFAEEWLEFLDGLPKGHVLNQDLKTLVEIVLNKDTGKVVRLGITRSSGVTAFDVAALSAIERAGPFGKAPDVIASADGNVYIHWEFHRDPVDACSTANARPFILKTPP